MKKIISLMALFSMFTFSQGAFAWTYEELNSINPFTNFGRGFGQGCGCEKPKVTKCNGQKTRMTFGYPTGFAAPVILRYECTKAIPVIYTLPCPCNKQLQTNTCNNCHRKQ